MGCVEGFTASHMRLCPAERRRVGMVTTSVVDPNTLNLDPDPGFWPNLDSGPDPGLYNQF